MVYKEKLLLLSWNHNLPKTSMFSTSWNSGIFILKIFLNIVHTQTQSLNVFNMNEICTPLDSQAPHRLPQLCRSYSAFAVTSGILQAMDTTCISTLWHHKKQKHARNLFAVEMEASHSIKSAGTHTHLLQRAPHGHCCRV